LLAVDKQPYFLHVRSVTFCGIGSLEVINYFVTLNDQKINCQPNQVCFVDYYQLRPFGGFVEKRPYLCDFARLSAI